MTRFSKPAVAKLCVELWQAGRTGGEIAEELGISRCCVLGHIYRQRRKGIAVAKRVTRVPARRRRSGVTRQRPKPRFTFKAAREAELAVVVREVPALPVLELSLPSGRCVAWHCEGGCVALLGEDAAHPQWCNCAVLPGVKWCREHYGRMYHPRG